MSLPRRFAVLAVGGPDTAPLPGDIDGPVAWYRNVSAGRWVPQPDVLAPVRLAHGLGRYTTQRGVSTTGPNSRSLMADVIAACGPVARARIGAAAGLLLLWVPGGFRPHVWYPARGGIALGGGAWCRRFAIIPANAPLGTVVHEIGHLLPGWPEGDSSAGSRCLMALGGLRRGGADPSPPAAPLALAAGWRDRLQLTADLSVACLAAARDSVASREFSGHHVVCEMRGSRLLAWTGPDKRPRLMAETGVDSRAKTPVLGLLAPALRHLTRARVDAPANVD